jgi:hypothetical protein
MDGFVPLDAKKRGQREKFGRSWVFERKENGEKYSGRQRHDGGAEVMEVCLGGEMVFWWLRCVGSGRKMEKMGEKTIRRIVEMKWGRGK